MLPRGIWLALNRLYTHDSGSERKRLWLLKNSFQGISPTKFVRKLFNVRLRRRWNSLKLLLWFLFQQPQAFTLRTPVVSVMGIFRQQQPIAPGQTVTDRRGM